MSRDWTTFRELLLPAVTAVTRGRRGRTLESELRDAIRTGRLAPDTRLPSSRDLAGQLGLSRGTVTTAYAQLVAEGYLIARRGSGTRVTGRIGTIPVAEEPVDHAAEPALDLSPGLPSLSAFPRSEWIAAQRVGLSRLSNSSLGYPDPAGLPVLRSELAAYLGRARAVTAAPGSLVVTNGAAEGLSMLARELRRQGHRTIAIEDPSHLGQAELLSIQGLRPVPVQVDEHGLRVDRLARTDCRAVLVTAAHQFPLGVVLHPSRRRRLLEWAAQRDGVIVEDDYDAEHRYDRPALGALQALDPRRVVYQSSLSKVLAPALRLGWMVLPPELRAGVVERKRLDSLGTATLPQAALAHLLRTGGYDRHLRRTRGLYRRHRDVLLADLRRVLPDCSPVGIAAGLHVVLRLPAGVDDRRVERELAERGVAAPALSNYTHEPANARHPGLVLGYAAPNTEQLHNATRLIGEVVSAQV